MVKQSSSAAAGRYAWIDQARGLGILLVVYAHVISGLMEAGDIPKSPLHVWSHYGIYLFHMPVFLFLSGLVVGRSLEKGSGRFLSGKLWTIVYPFFLWSLIQGGLKMAMPGDVNSPVTPGSLVAILWDPFDHFWFLYVLMACHVMMVLLGGNRALALGVAVATSLAAWIIPDAVWDPNSILHKIARNDIFYAAGFFLAPILLSPQARAPARPGLVAAGLWALFGVAAVYSAMTGELSFREPQAFPATCLGVAAFLVTVAALRGFGAQALTWLGAASMSIYILHVMASAGVRVIVERLGFDAPPIVDIVIGMIGGLALPALAHWMLSRLGWLHWFGLAPPPQQQRRPAAPAEALTG